MHSLIVPFTGLQILAIYHQKVLAALMFCIKNTVRSQYYAWHDMQTSQYSLIYLVFIMHLSQGLDWQYLT